MQATKDYLLQWDNLGIKCEQDLCDRGFVGEKLGRGIDNISNINK